MAGKKLKANWRAMTVGSTHPDYEANAATWSRARDVLSGEDAVKAAGEKYLARLDSQSEEECCLQRPGFFLWRDDTDAGGIFESDFPPSTDDLRCGAQGTRDICCRL